MTRPLLLDLFCGAGGAAVGYNRAGFDVVGVDIAPQPDYPFPFRQADAIVEVGMWFGDKTLSAVHASPPCQAYSVTRSLHDTDYPLLIDDTRLMLDQLGRPYIIENVVGAPLRNPVKLCGSSFLLGVRRHRMFETNWPLMGVPCAHPWQPEPIDVTGTGARRLGARTDGKGGNSRKPRSLDEARTAMGIDWMTRKELSEAIPPAFTEFIGGQLLEHITRSARIESEEQR